MKRLIFSSLLLCTFTLELCTFPGCKSPTAPVNNKQSDTTSHNYVWQTFILGDGNSSILDDVTIINDTLAYAAGEIYIKDSTGEYDDYNAAVWNGQKWNLLKIKVEDYGGISGYFPLKNIYAFSSTDIWYCSDANLIQYYNSNYYSKAFFMTGVPFNGQVRKMYGIDHSNIYCVGLGGAIYHYKNFTWQKIDLGTTANIFDVWGNKSSNNTSTTVYVPVSDLNTDNGIKKIFKIKGTQIDSLQWNTGKNVLSVWGTDDGGTLYAAGDGIFVNKGNGWEGISYGSDTRFFRIRGDGWNNIFVRGIRLVPPLNEVIAHYNGSTWKEYDELSGYYYYGIAVKGKLVIIVGENGNQAVAVIGKRID
ncbi:MAG: hypothetical protein P4L45_03505 [Ignavibacteriaceae bacterium]|nr:hypothetical protein [Ignavibacteriaceae bacterium]